MTSFACFSSALRLICSFFWAPEVSGLPMASSWVTFKANTNIPKAGHGDLYHQDTVFFGETIKNRSCISPFVNLSTSSLTHWKSVNKIKHGVVSAILKSEDAKESMVSKSITLVGFRLLMHCFGVVDCGLF